MPSPTRRPLTIIAVLTSYRNCAIGAPVLEMIPATRLTQELIRFETINPPGNETPCARHLGRLLEAAGFKTSYVPMGANRDNLIAWAGVNGNSSRFASRVTPMWCRLALPTGRSRLSAATSRTAKSTAGAAAT